METIRLLWVMVDSRFLGACLALFLAGASRTQDLQTRFDQRGIARLSYRGAVLVDLDSGVGDAFSVGGFKLGDKSGGWGANGKKAEWNAADQVLTWTWDWGSIRCRFEAPSKKDELRLKIAIENKSAQDLQEINVYPLGLMFPQLPSGFGAANYPQFRNNLQGPAVLEADYGSGAMVLANEDAKPLYVGLSPSGPANHYQIQIGTANDSSEGYLAKAVPLNRRVFAGKTEEFSVVLRFALSGTKAQVLAGDIFKSYGQAWPQTLKWDDRRPIGELFMTNPTTAPLSGASANPRNYTVAKGTDIRTPEGVATFRECVMRYAENAVRILKNMNAQGAIVWDLEGQQFPQPDTSYVGDPRQLAKLSPEMDSVADAFFKTFTSAGLKCGLTIRPQELDFSASTPVQKDVAAGQQSASLIVKMSYARKRWGCTIFYVDSNGGPLDATAPAVFGQVQKALPDVLVIPENTWPKDHAYTAPLASFTAPYKPLHTPAEVQAIWPHAFTVTYVGDAPNGDLKSNPKNPGQWAEFVSAVKKGDILTFRAWFDDSVLNRQVREIYAEAGRR